MELGKATLRRNGMNSLQDAVHPNHGLLWTDGKGIYLAPVHLYRDQVENVSSTRLGEFETVQSVHWSSSVDGDCCYMAAVHHHIVTVWRVSGAVPRLAFKQVRKINVQPVPQGCLWNPKNDVLCLLSRQQCSFYFRHASNRGSFAFPSLEQEKISCGCWTPDGKRLVVCVGAALLIYTWSDLETNINDFVATAWRIPKVSGTVTAIVPGSNSSMVCASDLPLETLCKNNNTDAFVTPDMERKPMGSSDILRPGEGMSVKDSLLNLEQNQKPQVQDSAMLTIIHLKPGTQDPSVLTSARLPGLLSPDLLHFQGDSQCIVVGSNTQNSLQVFALLDNHLLSAGHVTVSKEERPKGVCSLHMVQVNSADGVLVLIGTSAQSDSLFPSANNTASYKLSLKFFPIRPEKTHQLPNGHAAAAKTPSSSSLTKSESVRETRSAHIREPYHHTRQASYKGERPDHRFRSPDSSDSRIKLSLADINSGEAHPRLVEEITDSPRSIVEEVDGEGKEGTPEETLTVEQVDFSEVAPHFHNSELNHHYEISPVTTNDRTLNLPTSKLSSDHTKSEMFNLATSELSFKQSVTKDKTSDSAASEVNSDHPALCDETLDSAASGSLDSAASSSHPEQPPSSAATPRKAVSPAQTSSVKKSEHTVQADVGAEVRSVTGQHSCAYQLETPSPRPPNVNSVMSKKQSGEDDASVCSSISVSSNYEMLEKQIHAQNDQIAALQKRLEELATMVEGTASVFSSKYQEMTEPEVISIQCVVGGARVTRKFLLDSGRLQLDSVRQTFGLSSVELILEGEPLVLGANVDGYIPMKFTAGSFLQVTGIPIMYAPQLAQKKRSKEAAKS